MLVRIEPRIVGQKYGLGALELDRLILSGRLAGSTLYPIRNWPCHVYVMRITNKRILAGASFGEEDVEMIAWGTLHRSREGAARATAIGSNLSGPAPDPC